MGVYQMEYAGQIHLIWIKDIEKPREKKLNEAKGAVISDYQGELEKIWLEKLRKKYTVRIDNAVLNEIYAELVN